jgi:hypothetical protein
MPRKAAQKLPTPLIVAGPPRSGTRFVTNILNQFPGVGIEGEIPGPVIDRLSRVVRKCDAIYADPELGADQHWAIKKPEFMFSSWAALSKSPRRRKRGNRYYGYKSPYHEAFFDFYSRYFSPARPKYVCCIRAFEPHLLSVKARWSNRPAVYIAARYLLSLRQIRRMKRRAPEDVLLFFLDDYVAIGPEYLVATLFHPLGLSDVGRALEKAAEGPVNTAAKFGVRPKKQVSTLQKALLTLFPAPRRAYARLHSEFGAK